MILMKGTKGIKESKEMKMNPLIPFVSFTSFHFVPALPQATLCFFLTADKILLAQKKQGFGAGKWNGYGGKVLSDESISAAAVREVKEESGLDVDEKDLKPVAVNRFYIDGKIKFECSVFVARRWTAEPQATREMITPTWYLLSEIPFALMWPADHLWLPIILEGKKIRADIYLDKELQQVEKFSYEEWLC